MKTESESIGVGNSEGKVILALDEGARLVFMDPPNATAIAEDIAKNAYEAETGSPVGDDASLLAAIAKRRAIDSARPQLVTRAAHIIRSLQQKQTHPGLIAQHVVDSVLKEVT